MSDLKTDYKELEFDIDNGYESRHLLVINNGDGTVSFIDQTQYRNSDQYDSEHENNRDYINADDINLTHTEINSLASRYISWIGSYTALPTNLVNAQYSGRKKFEITELGGNLITLDDRTSYTVNGSAYGATLINSANTLLNIIETNYTSGYERLLKLLKDNGAKSTNLVTALDEMENAQYRAGFNMGVQTVKNNPSAYGCHTQAEVNALNTQNQTYLATMRPVASDINLYKVNNLDIEYENSATILSAISETLSLIQGGMERGYAYQVAQDAVTTGNGLRTADNASVSSYQTNCSGYVSRLGG